MLKKVFVFFIIFIIFISFLNFGFITKVVADWASYWGYRKQITINSSFIDNTLRNFPVLVYISSDSSLADNALSNGNDICFWNENASIQYNHEIVRFNSDTGELLAWVNLTTLSSDSDTVFYLYYGNPGADNQENKTGTWNSDYILVLHMNMSKGIAWDSTSYGHHFKAKGNLTYQQHGKVGYAVKGDNTSGYFVNTTMNLRNVEGFTWECWYNIGDYDPEKNQWFLFSSKYDPANDIRLTYYDGGFSSRGFQSYYDDGDIDGCSVTTYSWDNNSWHYYATTLTNESTGEVRQYHNITLDCADREVNFKFKGLDNNHKIGARTITGVPARYYKGLLDEIRISRIVRNQTWLNVSFHTSNQTSGFMTIGATEVAPITFSNPYPKQGATDVILTPRLRITVNESEGNVMNLTWLSNSSGTWLPFGYNNSIYNGTYTMVNSNFSDFNTTYYWRVLSETANASVYSVIFYFTTTPTYVPDPPYNITTDMSLSASSLNISWEKGKRADYTLIVRKNNTYPTNYTDGIVIYNDTGTWYNDTNFVSGMMYMLYSYNVTGNKYSSGAKAYYGALDINCYNESNPEQGLTFNVFISNKEGTETYEEENCTNTHTVDVRICPHGNNTIIIINSTGYKDRVYYMDLSPYTYTTLNAYLPPENKTKLYFFTVLDEVDRSVAAAKLTVMQYINETVGYENITSVLTDGYGQASVLLIPNYMYKIILEKPKFKKQIDDFLASPDDFTHTFRMYFLTPIYRNLTLWQLDITFDGYISENKLYINYSDITKNTTTVKFVVYEYNATTTITSSIYWYNASFIDEVKFNISINTSNKYTVTMEVDHKIHKQIFHILEFFVREKITTKTRFNMLFEANYGTNPFGWSNFIGFMIVLACMFSFGERGSGIGLIGTGMCLLFINNIIGFTAVAVVIPIVFVILGILVEWSTRQRGALS